jgi:hypothetical protein
MFTKFLFLPSRKEIRASGLFLAPKKQLGSIGLQQLSWLGRPNGLSGDQIYLHLLLSILRPISRDPRSGHLMIVSPIRHADVSIFVYIHNFPNKTSYFSVEICEWITFTWKIN